MHLLLEINVGGVFRVSFDLAEVRVESLDVEHYDLGQLDHQVSLLCVPVCLLTAIACVFIIDFVLLEVVFQALL